ncbi:MAG: hypothetical protein RLZ49_658, partial [Actinomycetota bacterium]
VLIESKIHLCLQDVIAPRFDLVPEAWQISQALLIQSAASFSSLYI